MGGVTGDSRVSGDSFTRIALGLPISADVLGVRVRGSGALWRVAGRLAGGEAVGPLPAGRRVGVRPGSVRVGGAAWLLGRRSFHVKHLVEHIERLSLGACPSPQPSPIAMGEG